MKFYCTKIDILRIFDIKKRQCLMNLLCTTNVTRIDTPSTSSYPFTCPSTNNSLITSHICPFIYWQQTTLFIHSPHKEIININSRYVKKMFKKIYYLFISLHDIVMTNIEAQTMKNNWSNYIVVIKRLMSRVWLIVGMFWVVLWSKVFKAWVAKSKITKSVYFSWVTTSNNVWRSVKETTRHVLQAKNC